VLSFDLSFPAILAPVGYSRMMYPGSDGGECAAAAAAGGPGSIHTLSTISGHPVENVRAATKGPAWYQLYLVGGREIAEHAIDRAKKAGFNALVVTIDTPVAGLRERDPRNGMKELLGGSLLSKLPYVSQFFARPSWFASFLLDTGSPTLRVLPEIVAAVGGQTEILLDGGIRRGSDIVKALCLGARAVLVGRAYAYGLGAAGKPGAARALQILREGVDRTLRLL